MKMAATWIGITLSVFIISFAIYSLFIYEPFYVPASNGFGGYSWDKMVVYQKPYETYETVFIAIFAFLIGLFATMIIDERTDFINPTDNYTVRLISKESKIQSLIGSRGASGLVIRYEFLFEDQNGDRDIFYAGEKLYFSTIEGNILDIDVKRKRVMKFSLVSVDGTFEELI